MNDSETRKSPHKDTESHRKNKYLFRNLRFLLCCSGWIRRGRKATERKLHETQVEKLWFYYVWSRITTSHGIAVKWYLRVYWLLPLSIVASFKKNRRFFCLAPTILLPSTVDSFGKHRRLFCWAPMNTWASQSTSFPKGVISCFHQTLFLFINWNCRQFTKTTDTCHKTFLILFDKTVMPKIPNPSDLLGRTRICACAIEERASMRRSLSLDWYPAI